MTTPPPPLVSFVIPTLNSERYIRGCLESIRSQDYPADRVEIVVCDGGSTDATREIASEFGAVIAENPDRIAESGKAVGVRRATGEILAFVDSDNELVGSDWLTRMVAPFADPGIVSSEVLRWAYVHEDGVVNRYCALSGINDPVSLFVGNYGRHSYLTGRWTDYPVRITPRPGYEEVELRDDWVPTMGANGYLVRTEPLRSIPGVTEMFFDIDVVQELVRVGHRRVARVDTEIRHLFSRGARDFARKTRRRAQDFLHYRREGDRLYRWRPGGIIRFSLATVLVLPVLIQTARGLRRRPDAAWAFHPLACWITLAVYAEAVIRQQLGGRMYDRGRWKQ